ncbi:MAG: acyl carrier protein [Saprospiraceae bacterium]|nr:acyl carrier protein [Saprospiraceae bacterium]
MENIKEEVKTFILASFVNESETGPIGNDTPLLSSGIIDSISALQLVEFLETTFKFQFQPHEVDQDNLNSLDLIEEFVKGKLA